MSAAMCSTMCRETGGGQVNLAREAWQLCGAALLLSLVRPCAWPHSSSESARDRRQGSHIVLQAAVLFKVSEHLTALSAHQRDKLS